MPRYVDDLETPRVVALILQRLAPPPDQRPRLERALNLSFHFGGLMLVTQPDGRRERIVASGFPDEVGPLLDRLPRTSGTREMAVDLPDPFEEVVYSYARRFRREEAEKRA